MYLGLLNPFVGCQRHSRRTNRSQFRDFLAFQLNYTFDTTAVFMFGIYILTILSTPKKSYTSKASVVVVVVFVFTFDRRFLSFSLRNFTSLAI